jgi:LacI family transcriptional regulator
VSTAELGSPVVAVDPHVGSDAAPTVDADNFHGAQLAVEHLLALGHRRIGFLGRPPRDLESGRQRERGYRQALENAGIPFDPALVRAAGYAESESTESALQLLQLDDRPTAVFAANDVSAIATMEVAMTLGMQVPRDLSVIGFDNVPESTVVRPALTTIEQPLQLMGQRAVEMLLDLLAGKTPEPMRLRLPTRLVERDSCAPPPPDGATGPAPEAAASRPAAE